MSTFISTLGWGFAALLAVAAFVALWEHGRAQARGQRVLPTPEPRRAAHLDVDFDQFAEPAHHPDGDQAQRQAALGGALDRMVTPPATSARASTGAGQAWIETEPMVAASLQVELPAEQRAESPRA